MRNNENGQRSVKMQKFWIGKEQKWKWRIKSEIDGFPWND